MFSEAKYLQSVLAKTIFDTSADLVLGNGDDAAVFTFPDSAAVAISVDAFVEGIHFRRRYFSFQEIGSKAIESATSDLIAVGARPRFCLLSLALPEDVSEKELEQLQEGVGAACRRLGLLLIGGDTCASTSGIQMHVTVIGAQDGCSAISRSSAEPGDLLFLTGPVGAAQLGFRSLEKLQSRPDVLSDHMLKFLQTRCRVDCLSVIQRYARAAIDVSDGLGKDLSSLCMTSQVGARVLASALPIPKEMFGLRRTEELMKPLLESGEEYEILFAVGPAEFLVRPGEELELNGLRLFCIGECVEDKSIWLECDEGSVPWPKLGFSHGEKSELSFS